MRALALVAAVLLSATTALASSYVVVGISGYGTGENGKGQPSGAHDNLPSRSGRISHVFKLTHKANKERINEVLAPFNCRQGVQESPDLKLIIMANSWGAGKAHKLAKAFAEKCGEEVDLVVMIDGVGKPMHAYGKRPQSRMCVNYYQTRSTVHGKAIDGCENTNLGADCQSAGIANCHIEVEWSGSERGRNDILDHVARAQ